jgi:DNA polymerase (family 10)
VARKAGALLSVNTDSHRPGNMDMARYGVDIARRAGLEKSDVINTYSLGELKKWRSSRD